MTLWSFLSRCEAEFLAGLMVRFDGNARAAAKAAGISRATIYKRLRKHNLLAPRSRVGGNAEWRALQ